MAANIKTPCRAWSPDHATACCTAHQKSATNPAPSVRRSALTPPFTPIFLYAKNFATNYHQTYCCHKHSCKLALFLFQGPASPHRLAFPHPPHSRGLSRGLRNAARGVHCSLPAFAPRFRSRSIVAPAHKPATIFSDQSPRDEHERLREVRVRPEGNGATKKPQHSVRLFLVHHRGLSRALKPPHWGVFARRTGGGPELFSSPDGAPD